MSLLKYVNNSSSNGNGRGSVYWGRADLDGIPFRGMAPPLLREEEFEDRLVRVQDFKNSTFYTGDPAQNKIYTEIMDSVSNGWFQLIHIDRWRKEGDNSPYIYLEWTEPFLEDGKAPLTPGT
jgi:hypothetical protein